MLTKVQDAMWHHHNDLIELICIGFYEALLMSSQHNGLMPNKHQSIIQSNDDPDPTHYVCH